VYTIRYFLLNPANQKLHHGSQTGRSQRVPFIAAAEIMEVDTEARLTARTDLSQGGCCLDMVNPLPQGTSVKLAIAHGDRTFGAIATVFIRRRPWEWAANSAKSTLLTGPGWANGCTNHPSLYQSCI
jgi:PilZ domain